MASATVKVLTLVATVAACTAAAAPVTAASGDADAAPLPVLPVTVAAPDSWAPPQKSGLYYGDVRAVVDVTAAAGATVDVQVWWRRRDPNPAVKGLIVTDSKHTQVKLAAPPSVAAACGRVSFTADSGPGTYYVYHLPHYQSGGGAHTHFHWYNCTMQTPICVLDTETGIVSYDGVADRGAAARSDAGSCATIVPATGGTVVRLEGRDAFHGPPVDGMDLVATPSEVSALAAAHAGKPFVAFAETRHRRVRMLGGNAHVPVSVAQRGVGTTVLSGAQAYVGEFWTFQIGIYAAFGDVVNMTMTASDLVPQASDATAAAAPTVPASAIRCFNLGGTDISGTRFAKSYSVRAGSVGSMWFGVELPADASVQGVYNGTITLGSASAPLSVAGSAASTVAVSIGVEIVPAPAPAAGGVVPLQGDLDITRMTRLRWLDSSLGIDDHVTEPFVPVTVDAKVAESTDAFAVETLHKRFGIGANGLPTSAVVTVTNPLGGGSVDRAAFAAPVVLAVTGADGKDLPMTPTTAAHVTKQTDVGAYWTAELAVGSTGSTRGTDRRDTTQSGASGLVATVTGNCEFESFLEFNITLTNAGVAPLNLSDVRVDVTPSATDASGQPVQRYMVGMGAEGSPLHPLQWRWYPQAPDNMVWVGRVDSGVFVKLKGAGLEWDVPNDGQDFPAIPFIPTSWGGPSATPNATGVNVTVAPDSSSVVVSAFSGPRTMQPGESVTYLFDLAVTPSHPVNMTQHWGERYTQVGYGTPYLSPQTVKGRGTTVVTLHQGVPGVINGSLVNPYISYPFQTNTVPFLSNYTQQSNELGMAVKFYYTIRELSNHAEELYALLALDGEVFLDDDPYTIPQPGYCQDWDCHGGSVFLHQYVIANYSACWQQALSNGEWDASICDTGVNRWFNYYVEGLAWSISQAPHINGVYYDGIGFSRRSMRRIRKAADAAAASVGSKFRPQLDVHTGRSPPPPACSYLNVFPYVDAVWNGEGFQFNKGPAYWLIEVSGQMHGLSGDRLGGSPPSDDFKGMTFGMTERNTATASALWSFWDAEGIADTTMVGWWEDEDMRPVTLHYNCSGAVEPYHTTIHATAYVAPGSHTIVAIGSWCPSAESVGVTIDWAALGFNGAGDVTATAPAIQGVQSASALSGPEGPFQVAGGMGLLYVIRAK